MIVPLNAPNTVNDKLCPAFFWEVVWCILVEASAGALNHTGRGMKYLSVWVWKETWGSWCEHRSVVWVPAQVWRRVPSVGWQEEVHDGGFCDTPDGQFFPKQLKGPFRGYCVAVQYITWSLPANGVGSVVMEVLMVKLLFFEHFSVLA